MSELSEQTLSQVKSAAALDDSGAINEFYILNWLSITPSASLMAQGSSSSGKSPNDAIRRARITDTVMRYSLSYLAPHFVQLV